MKTKTEKVRAGSRRPALRGTIVLLLGGSALVAARTMHASEPGDQDAAHATELLNSVRGSTPLACRLVNRALQNNWGNGHGMVAGPESIGDAGDAAFDWAVSDAVEPSVLPQLRTALDDTDMCVRRTAASLIGRMRASTGVAADLSAQLSSANARTREAALLAIGYAGKNQDRDATERLLRDSDAAVKLAAVWALGMIGDAAAVPALTALLKDADANMRANAAYALGQIESPTAIPALVSLLGSDTQPIVRRAAAAALGRIE